MADLRRRLEKVEPVVEQVAVMKNEMGHLTEAVKANTVATEQVTEQMEKAQAEPITRARNFRSQMLIALAAAVAGGGIAVLGGLIASHP